LNPWVERNPNARATSAKNSSGVIVAFRRSRRHQVNQLSIDMPHLRPVDHRSALAYGFSQFDDAGRANQ
jgi:hypothetical protein